jgi:hypothetical protein
MRFSWRPSSGIILMLHLVNLVLSVIDATNGNVQRTTMTTIFPLYNTSWTGEEILAFQSFNNDQDVNYEICLEELIRNDINGDMKLNDVEYFQFGGALGRRTECWNENDIEAIATWLRPTFNQLSCACSTRPGASGVSSDCCLGTNAYIPINGTTSGPELVNNNNNNDDDDDDYEQQHDWLRKVCLRTDQAIISFCPSSSSTSLGQENDPTTSDGGVNVPPSTTTTTTSTNNEDFESVGEVQDDEEDSDSDDNVILWGLATGGAGVVAFLCLCCYLCFFPLGGYKKKKDRSHKKAKSPPSNYNEDGGSSSRPPPPPTPNTTPLGIHHDSAGVQDVEIGVVPSSRKPRGWIPSAGLLLPRPPSHVETEEDEEEEEEESPKGGGVDVEMGGGVVSSPKKPRGWMPPVGLLLPRPPSHVETEEEQEQEQAKKEEVVDRSVVISEPGMSQSIGPTMTQELQSVVTQNSDTDQVLEKVQVVNDDKEEDSLGFAIEEEHNEEEKVSVGNETEEDVTEEEDSLGFVVEDEATKYQDHDDDDEEEEEEDYEEEHQVELLEDSFGFAEESVVSSEHEGENDEMKEEERFVEEEMEDVLAAEHNDDEEVNKEGEQDMNTMEESFTEEEVPFEEHEEEEEVHEDEQTVNTLEESFVEEEVDEVPLAEHEKEEVTNTVVEKQLEKDVVGSDPEELMVSESQPLPDPSMDNATQSRQVQKPEPEDILADTAALDDIIATPNGNTVALPKTEKSHTLMIPKQKDTKAAIVPLHDKVKATAKAQPQADRSMAQAKSKPSQKKLEPPARQQQQQQQQQHSKINTAKTKKTTPVADSRRPQNGGPGCLPCGSRGRQVEDEYGPPLVNQNENKDGPRIKKKRGWIPDPNLVLPKPPSLLDLHSGSDDGRLTKNDPAFQDDASKARDMGSDVVDEQGRPTNDDDGRPTNDDESFLETKNRDIGSDIVDEGRQTNDSAGKEGRRTNDSVGNEGRLTKDNMGDEGRLTKQEDLSREVKAEDLMADTGTWESDKIDTDEEEVEEDWDFIDHDDDDDDDDDDVEEEEVEEEEEVVTDEYEDDMEHEEEEEEEELVSTDEEVEEIEEEEMLDDIVEEESGENEDEEKYIEDDDGQDVVVFEIEYETESEPDEMMAAIRALEGYDYEEEDDKNDDDESDNATPEASDPLDHRHLPVVKIGRPVEPSQPRDWRALADAADGDSGSVQSSLASNDHPPDEIFNWLARSTFDALKHELRKAENDNKRLPSLADDSA